MVSSRTLLAAFLVLFVASHSTQGSPTDTDLNDLVVPDVDTDFDIVIKDYSASKKKEGNSFGGNANWQTGFFSELMTFLQNSQLTDCSFTVGPEGKEEKIEAHAVVLAIASPVFKSALTNSSSFRLKEWQPSEFRALLRMIYSGKLCFKDFEEACVLMRHAKSIGLESVFDAAQNYIEAHMYPDKHWDALICARQASAEKLLETVSQIISANSTKYMRDPGFNKISNNDLLRLMTRDDLTVRSEFELYGYVINWALAQLKTAGQKATAEQLKEMIGADLLKNIRFLTMTALEYSTLHSVLDYDDSVTVKQNILHPGIMEMPKYLSSSRAKRNLLDESKEETFRSVVLDEKCENATAEKSIYDYLTTSIVNGKQKSCQFVLSGIQVPKSLEARKDCSVKEHFDVLILNPENEVVYKQAYDQAPPCTERRFVNATGSWSVTDNKVLSLKFDREVTILKSIADERWKVKIVFRDVKEYPTSVKTGFVGAEASWAYYFDSQNFSGSTSQTYYVPIKKNFVSAMVKSGKHVAC